MVLSKKIVFLLACVSLLFCVITFQDTYAKYTSSIEGSTNINIARWKLSVNNNDVVSSSGVSNIITPVLDENDNIAPGVIAPTSTGHFEIVLDGSHTDVSYDYTITVGTAVGSVADLKMKSATLDGAAVSISSAGVIRGSVSHSDVNKIHTVIVYLEWIDGTGETMDNHADTMATIVSTPTEDPIEDEEPTEEELDVEGEGGSEEPSEPTTPTEPENASARINCIVNFIQKRD